MAKTIKVSWLIDRANAFFANSTDSAAIDRIALASFLSDILHATGNYAGFNYLTEYGKPGNDSTRVLYYKSHKLND